MRTRVRHLEYGWTGDLREIKADAWYVIAWDNGETSTEFHSDVWITNLSEPLSETRAT